MRYLFILLFFALASCTSNNSKCPEALPASYFDNSGRDDLISGGVKMIPVETPSGTFRVWTKRTGNNPDIKVLILHGGPGFTHEYLEGFDSYFPGAGIEYYYYDQLGSYYSDQPEDSSLWNLPRFVEEVEQVRQALKLDSSNFYLLGQSWGGILAVEYALKYQQNIKGLIVSNMMMSVPDYNKYAQEVLGPALGDSLFSRIKSFEDAGDFHNQAYIDLLMANYYPQHVLRMPLNEWPDPVMRAFKHANMVIYSMIQGPSEFGIVGDAQLKNWDRTPDLHNITVPTLCVGAKYDTMDPQHMEKIAGMFAHGRYLNCPNGSHLALYDDPEVYSEGIIRFIKDVHEGSF